MHRIVLLAALAPLVVSCVVGPIRAPIHFETLGRFGRDAFYHEYYPYRVLYEPQTRALLSDDWLLDNFYERDDAMHAKETDAYLEVLSFDTDGDGAMEINRRFPSYDLRFLHRRSGAVIWLSTFPLSDEYQETDLRVLGERYVEAVAGGAGYATIRLGKPVETYEKRFATRVLTTRDTQVDGAPALEITFEVANVDQLELSSESRMRVVRVVMVRPGFQLRLNGADYRVLVILGHSALPAAFERSLADFAGLVNRVRFSYDAVIDSHSDEVLACLGTLKRDTLTVRFKIDADGHVEETELDPPSQIGEKSRAATATAPIVPDSARQHDEALDRQISSIEQCIADVFAAGMDLPATGEDREVSWRFQRGRKWRRSTSPALYTTGPAPGRAPSSASAPAGPSQAAPGSAPAPTGAAEPARTSAPADASPDEATLRASIDAAKADVLACTGGEHVALEITHASGQLRVALRGELAGSPEERCVQQALADLSAPSGEGRVIHLVK